MTNDSKSHRMLVYTNGTGKYQDQELIVEEPLAVRVNGQPYSVVMRTPGDEMPHAAGFCLAEGLIDHPDDISDMGFCTEEGVNVVTLILTEARRKKVADLLLRKGFVSQTSCGICGKEVISDLHQILTPAAHSFKIPAVRALAAADSLSSFQRLYKQTRAAHAAMVLDAKGAPLSFGEDVGRHNALDKAIGKVFLEKKIETAAFAVMSSRVSYELVQKAARARLELLIGISRPTALAVELARSVNMTLACAKDDDLMVFCHDERITPSSSSSSNGC